MQRLHPQPVAHKEQALPRDVEQREGEHATQARQQVRPPRPPAVDQHFGIAVGTELRANPLQLAADLGEVVDFAVKGNDNLFVGAEHRLCAAAQINDRQPSVTEPYALRGPNACAVGATVHHGVGHHRNPRRIDGLGGFEMEDTGDAAHSR